MATPCKTWLDIINKVGSVLLSRLLYITEGKYGNQLEKFRVVLFPGSHGTGSTTNKVTESDSAKPGAHIRIFFLSQGSRVRVEMGTNSEKVCRVLSIYGALMLFNFCGDRGSGLRARTQLLGVSN